MPYRGRNTQDRLRDDRTSRQDDSVYSSRVLRDLQRDLVSKAERERGISRSRRDTGHTRDLSSGSSWSTSAGDSISKGSLDSASIVGKPMESSIPTLGGWGSASTVEGTSAWDSAGGSTSWSTGGWGDTATERGWSSNPWGGTSTAWGDGGWGNNSQGDYVWGGNNEDLAQESKTIKADGSHPMLSANQPPPSSPSLLSRGPAISRLLGSTNHQREAPNRPSSPPKATTGGTVEPTVKLTIGPSSIRAPAVTRPRLPLPTRLQKQIPPTTARVQGATDDQKFPSPSPVTPQDWSKIPLSGSIIGHAQQDDAVSDASGPITALSALDPHELHSRVIKEVMQAILIRCDLIKAEERKDKWRKARQSSCYQHSTPAAQKILESTNHKYSEELAKLNKQLLLSLKKVVKYTSALKVHQDLLERGVDVKKVMAYTDELRDWIIDLELPRRVYAAASKIDGERRRGDVSKRQKREKVTMLRNAVCELELTITDISDDLVHMQDIQPKRLQEAFYTVDKVLVEEGQSHVLDMDKLFSVLGVGADTVMAIKQQIQIANQKVVEQFPKVDGLRANLEILEIEVANLKQKEAEITAFCQETGARFKMMEMWKKDDKIQLGQLSKKIEILHWQSPYSQPQNESTVSSCKVDDILPYTDALITAYVMQEVKPALDAIVAAVDTSSHHLTAQFNKLVEQVVIKTYNLIQMALKMNGLIPQLYPRSTQ